MSLRIVGAGLPRTGTSSLRSALGELLGGPCLHMSAIPGHPFNLGGGWQAALVDQPTDWRQLTAGFVAAVDWPASLFWRELSDANPDALVLLSVRESAQVWWESMNATVLPVTRMSQAPDWTDGRDLLALMERFAGTEDWDDPARLMAAYDAHNAAVRATIPAHRLLEWRAADGWQPICRVLDLPVPTSPFPWTNRRADWG